MDVKPGYKQTEVGVIPEDWNVFQLSEHFRIYAGGDVPKHSVAESRSEKHPHPIFANALQNHGLYGFTGERRAKADSLTITARGYLGHAEYRDEAFFPIVRLLVLEPSGALDARFSTFAVNERVKFAFESTGVPQLTAPQVGKYSVAAPSLPEQRAIAAALSDVDALLGGLDRLIAKKRDLKQAAMQQLLTSQTRLPGFGGAWDEFEFGEIASIRNAKVVASSVPSGTQCVELESIDGEGSGRLLMSTDADGISPKYSFKKGDVLFGRLRAYLRKYWLATFDGICSTEIWPLLARDTRLYGAFLHLLVQTDRFVNAACVSYGTHMPRSDWAVLKELLVQLPPLPEQMAIAAVLSDMDAELAALAARRDKTRDLKQAMMQELLTGRTRLVKPEAACA
jgi:type I restriction enzyme S subunit